MNLETFEMMNKAFRGDPKVKEKYLARVEAHRDADEIIHNTYWDNGVGCAVGCTIHSDDHQAYEDELGIPEQLAYLQDMIFDSLPIEEARDLTVDFLESIPVGADLRPVVHQFLHWLLVDSGDGVIQYVQNDGVRDVIQEVADLHRQALRGHSLTNEQPGAPWDAKNAKFAVTFAFKAAGRDAGEDAKSAAIARQKAKLLELLASSENGEQ